jgi:hypothetical protein
MVPSEVPDATFLEALIGILLIAAIVALIIIGIASCAS